MSRSRASFWPIVTVIVGVLIVLIALPQEWKTWAPGIIRTPTLHLGLDLVGGTQLDFRISEEEINRQMAQLEKDIATLEEKNAPAADINKLQAQQYSIQEQKRSLVEAIRTVIERRINALGVSEAVITPSYIGDEKHLLVECPGVVDTQECIKIVGKTIQLEFKEEFTEPTEEFKEEVVAKADLVERRITESGSTLQKEGENVGTALGLVYQDSHAFYKDTLPQGLEDLWNRKPGQMYRREGSIRVASQTQDGGVEEEDVPGIFLGEVVQPLTETGRTVMEAPRAFSILAETETGATYAVKEDILLDNTLDARLLGALRGMRGGDLKAVDTGSGTAHILFLRGVTQGKEEVDVSHILVAYKGAQEAAGTVTRTKEEALARAQELKAKIATGTAFEDVAKADSDGASTRTEGGKLGKIARGSWPAAFEDVAFGITAGEVSEPVETVYGYHLIRTNGPAQSTPDAATYDDLSITGAGSLTRAELIIGKLKRGEVHSREEALTLRLLFFSLIPSGWKDTTLDGKHFRSANVSVDPVTNIPVVQILFDDEGGKLFQELTKRNVNKRIAIFVGGELVSAPTVQQEIAGGSAVITGSKNFDEARTLAQDLNTGAIPAPIHLVGQYTVEATLGAAALRTSLQAAFIGIIILMVYMIIMYRFLGLMADVALAMYATMLFAILKLPLLLFSSSYIVLTLAGMAGIILSIGMAVDANVLVFERVKEELRKGKLVRTAVEASFRHAWPAIRDSNVSTLITCGILFIIGTSIVRGFAVTLAMGVMLSMLTAVVVTRWLLRHLARTPLGERPELFCGPKLKREDAVGADVAA
ncbi:MAG: protein translocase subunit SecD [Candidatus Peribacteraceae bacterium]|jgi:protein-export membrane protein SecD